MAICRLACPYNTLDGCKVKEYGGVCQLTNTAQPITGYKMTNADRIRAMNNKELAKMLTVGKGAFACSDCWEFGAAECSTKCDVRCLEWLQQPAKEG